MSISEPPTSPLSAAATTLEQASDQVLDAGGSADEESVRRVVTAAARLHARYTEVVGPLDPLRDDVSPTESVDLACGLLRSRGLNPFDLALWFSRTP